MDDEDKIKVFDLRCKSKMGIVLKNSELNYLSNMFEEYPDDYKAMNKEIFETTRPFGSK